MNRSFSRKNALVFGSAALAVLLVAVGLGVPGEGGGCGGDAPMTADDGATKDAAIQVALAQGNQVVVESPQAGGSQVDPVEVEVDIGCYGPGGPGEGEEAMAAAAICAGPVTNPTPPPGQPGCTAPNTACQWSRGGQFVCCAPGFVCGGRDDQSWCDPQSAAVCPPERPKHCSSGGTDGSCCPSYAQCKTFAGYSYCDVDGLCPTTPPPPTTQCGDNQCCKQGETCTTFSFGFAWCSPASCGTGETLCTGKKSGKTVSTCCKVGETCRPSNTLPPSCDKAPPPPPPVDAGPGVGSDAGPQGGAQDLEAEEPSQPTDESEQIKNSIAED